MLYFLFMLSVYYFFSWFSKSKLLVLIAFSDFTFITMAKQKADVSSNHEVIKLMLTRVEHDGSQDDGHIDIHTNKSSY